MDATDKERKDVQKAMAYDLLKLLRKDTEKSYSYQEIESIIDAYVEGPDTYQFCPLFQKWQGFGGGAPKVLPKANPKQSLLKVFKENLYTSGRYQ